MNRTTAELQHSFVVSVLLFFFTSKLHLKAYIAKLPFPQTSGLFAPGDLVLHHEKKSVEKFLLITPGSSFNQQFQVFKKADINCLIIREGYLFSLSYFANRRKLILSKESHLFYFHILVYILNASIPLFC